MGKTPFSFYKELNKLKEFADVLQFAPVSYYVGCAPHDALFTDTVNGTVQEFHTWPANVKIPGTLTLSDQAHRIRIKKDLRSPSEDHPPVTYEWVVIVFCLSGGGWFQAYHQWTSFRWNEARSSYNSVKFILDRIPNDAALEQITNLPKGFPRIIRQGMRDWVRGSIDVSKVRTARLQKALPLF